MARRPSIRLLVVPQRRAALEKLVLHAMNLRIPIVEVEGGSLTALAGFDGHQGIALVVEPRRYAGLEDVLARATERGEPPFILVLDSLEDPHNVGSLLRSAEAAGVHGVLYPTHRQAPLSPSAVKASAGAVEHLLLCPVDDLPGALSDLRARGVRIAGADGGAPLTARQSDLRGPLAIVVGSEGQGLGPVVRRRCDLLMRIPMRGAVGSLNAAVAGSILLFEAVAQRDVVEPGRPDAVDLDEGAGVEGNGSGEAAATTAVVTVATRAVEPLKVGESGATATPTKSVNRTKSAKPMKAGKPRNVDQPLRAGGIEPASKPGKPDKPAKAQTLAKADKPAKAQTLAKADKPAKAHKPARTATPESTIKLTGGTRAGTVDEPMEVAKPSRARAAKPAAAGAPTAAETQEDDLLPSGGAVPPRGPRPSGATRTPRTTGKEGAGGGHA